MTSAAPSRPALLVIDPDDARRHALSLGLYAQGYEAVPVRSPEQGLQFARSIGPSVIVAPLGLPEIGSGTPLLSPATEQRGARTVLFFGPTVEAGEELPEEVLYVAIGDSGIEELAHRVRLVLIGRELGVHPDPELSALLGDLGQISLVDLVRGFARLNASGTVELERAGRVGIAHGQVVLAEAGSALGAKAFCRLVRRRAGPFRIRLELPEVADDQEQAITGDSAELLVDALADALVVAPDPRLRVQLVGRPSGKDELGRAIIRLIAKARAEHSELTVGKVLDELPERDGEIEARLSALVAERAVALVEPHSAVAIVTDSTADLPPDLARAAGIQIVPLYVHFGLTTFRDGVEITPHAFYAQLGARGSEHPHTSPPAPADFRAVYSTLVGRADIVSVHISAKMSLTAAEASRAVSTDIGTIAALRRAGPPPRIEVVDSQSVSFGVGLLALFAARMAERGLGAAAIAERLAAMRERVQILFVVDTLEYLARGGRIGKARAVLGGILGIKPILGVIDGEVTAVDRVRGGRRAHARMLELFRERLDPERPVIGGVVHANAPMWADRLRTLLAENLPVRELHLGEIGPVVGTHGGPGTVGAALFQPRDDEELALVAPPES